MKQFLNRNQKDRILKIRENKRRLILRNITIIFTARPFLAVCTECEKMDEERVKSAN